MFGFSNIENISLYVRAKMKYKIVSSACKSLLKRDEEEYFSQIGESILKAYESGNQSEGHKAMKCLLLMCRSQKKTKKFMRIVDDFGVPAQSLHDERVLFRDHFSELLGGTTCLFEHLVVKDRTVSSSRYDDISHECLHKCIPSISDVVMQFNSLVKGKGFGESRVCTDVYKRFSSCMAVYYYPLYTKSYIRIQPPLQSKGGLLVELFKMKGSSAVRGNYRDILLSDDGGKSFVKPIRYRFLPHAIALSYDSQYGRGIPWG